MPGRLLLVLFLAFVFGSIAQPTKPNFARLNTANGAVELKELYIDVKASGNYATTTLEMKFFNDNERVLEGNLELPLPEAAYVVGFSMDMNGVWRDAVIVEKQKARQTFESIERRGVDPALLEKKEGNVFSVRVFPIPVNGYKSVRITYEEKLTPQREYLLPLHFPQTLSRFSLKANVLNESEMPVWANNKIQDVSFSSNNGVFEINKSWEKVKANRDFGFRLMTENKERLFIETDKHDKGLHFFQTQWCINLQPQQKAAPHSLCILWDVSESSKGRNMEKDIAVIRSYISNIQNLKVTVATFSVVMHKIKPFDIVNSNCDELMAFLRKSTPDGATQLGSLDLTRFDADEFILSSDGITTIGNGTIADLTRPINILQSSKTANVVALQAIAEKSGGQYLNLNTLSEQKAVAALQSQTMHVIRLTTTGKVEVNEPSAMETGCVKIFGRLNGDAGKIKIEVGYGNHVVETRELEVLASQAKDCNGIVARQCGNNELNTLLKDKEKNKDKIIALSRQYSIVTDYTSMLILDRLQDYIQYNIEPPAELKVAYDSVMKVNGKTSTKTEKEKLESVERMAKECIGFHSIDFDARLKEQKRKEEERLLRLQENKASSVITPAFFETRDTTSQQGTGKISVHLMSQDGEGLVNAPINIVDARGANTSVGSITDLDGNAILNNLAPGKYSLKCAFIGYKANVLKDVVVKPGVNTRLRVKLKPSYNNLEEVEIIAYKVPLIERGNTTMSSTTETRELSSANIQNVTDLASSTAGVYQEDEAQGISIRGAREDATVYYVNGRKVIGRPNVPAQGYQSPIYQWTSEDMADFSDVVAVQDTQKHIRVNASKQTFYGLLLDSTTGSVYENYLRFKPIYGQEVAYFIDAADILKDKGQNAEALRVLSSIAEIRTENPALLRILAHRLEQIGEQKLAVQLFEKITQLRGEDPQSFRDLALALEKDGRYDEAVAQFIKVLKGNWDGRFPEIEKIVLNELNHLLNAHPNISAAKQVDKAWVVPVEYKARVVLTWDTDNCDIDLWVTEPNGEKCYYSHNQTQGGGHMSRDFTQGFGPEEYVIRQTQNGSYKIQANYYGSRQVTKAEPTTLQVKIFRDYGTSSEKVEDVSLRLDNVKETIDVATIEF
jgi:hypothetical protein